jgi:competence protein ComEC
VDILQVGHHGSETSSRLEFLNAVSPQWALIGAGPKKYSGHVLPDDSVVSALVDVVGDASRILRTDENDAAGCSVADRIGDDDHRPGGCDNYILDF